MRVFVEATELIEALRARTERVIAVDGWLGAGKSYLAGTLGPPLGRVVVDVDAFQEPGYPNYLSALDLPGIAKVLGRDRMLLIGGAFMREVLDKAGAPPALHIYVKRMDQHGWLDEDEAVGRIEGFAGLDRDCPPSEMTLAMRAYHEGWRPHERADIVFERF